MSHLSETRPRNPPCAFGATVTLILVLACAPLHQQPDPFALAAWGQPDTNRGTLGAELEHEFTLMLQSCGVSTLDKDVRSRIPLILHEAVDSDMYRTVLAIPRESGWNLFRRVTTELSGPLFTSSLTDYLDESTIPQSTLPQPDPGSSSVIFRQTCSSVVDAAIKAGLKVPFASVAGALETGYQDHVELDLVEGRFFSPLAQALSPRAPASLRAGALLGIFGMYGVDSSTGSRRYVAGFSGLALYILRRAGESTTASLKGSAGASLGPVTFDALLRDSLFRNGTANVQGFVTYLFEPSELKAPPKNSIADLDIKDLSKVVQFVTLPSLKDIADTWDRLVRQDSVVEVAVDPDSSTEETVSIPLRVLPHSACDARQWVLIKYDFTKPLTWSLSGDSVCKAVIKFRTLDGVEDFMATERQHERDPLEDNLFDVVSPVAYGTSGAQPVRAEPLPAGKRDSAQLSIHLNVKLSPREDLRIASSQLKRTSASSDRSSASAWQVMVSPVAIKRTISWGASFPDGEIAAGTADTTCKATEVPAYSPATATVDSSKHTVTYKFTRTFPAGKHDSTTTCRPMLGFRIPLKGVIAYAKRWVEMRF